MKGLPQLLTFGPRDVLIFVFFFHCDEGQILDPHGAGMTKLHPGTLIVNN